MFSNIMHVWQSYLTIKITIIVNFLLLRSAIVLRVVDTLVQFSFNYSDFSLEKGLITTVF